MLARVCDRRRFRFVRRSQTTGTGSGSLSAGLFFDHRAEGHLLSLAADAEGDLASRFGLVYYGCCDPLDGKLREVRMIPNVRKISMSPWAKQERGAEGIGGDFVFSRKPNPALLAWDDFRIDAVREELVATREVTEKHGCPLELILKDISTVRYEPQRLWEWAEIARRVVGA